MRLEARQGEDWQRQQGPDCTRGRKAGGGGGERGERRPAFVTRVTRGTEFTKDGTRTLVSIREMDGAVIVYDTATFRKVKRLPIVKPSGKSNVWNKITFENGTSH
jgi:hypothetical protein